MNKERNKLEELNRNKEFTANNKYVDKVRHFCFLIIFLTVPTALYKYDELCFCVRIVVAVAPRFFPAPSLDELPDISPYMPTGGGPMDRKSCNFPTSQEENSK